MTLEAAELDLDTHTTLVIELCGVLWQTEDSTVELTGFVGLLDVCDELVAERDLSAGDLLSIGHTELSSVDLHSGQVNLVLTL